MLAEKILHEKMKSPEPLNVLLLGNNPIEMGNVMDKIKQLRGRIVNTEIAFDTKSLIERLVRFTPNFILIDDNIGQPEFSQTIQALSRNKKTRDLPITVLKNSNFMETAGSNGFIDYLLKKNLSVEALYSAIKNALKFRRTQLYLHKAYVNRKGQLMRLVGG